MKNKILLNKLIILFAIVPAVKNLSDFLEYLPYLNHEIDRGAKVGLSATEVIVHTFLPLFYCIAAIAPALLAKIELQFAGVNFGPRINLGIINKLNTKNLWFIVGALLLYTLYSMSQYYILSWTWITGMVSYIFLIAVAVLSALRIKDILFSGNESK